MPRIKYNDAITFERLKPFDDIAEFEYITDTRVDSVDKQSSFDTFNNFPVTQSGSFFYKSFRSIVIIILKILSIN